MEFEVITLLLIVVIVILQIVILANQKKNAKLLSDLTTFKPKPQQPDQNRDRDRFRDRKDTNFRNNRRNQQDFRPKQPPAAAQSAASSTTTGAAGAVDNVEKSLRDINLKLKNAERDQETARRKIQENIGNDQPRQRQQSEGNRGGRDRDNNRDRGDRNRDRDPRRGDRNNRSNWRPRNNQENTGSDTEQNTGAPANHPAMDNGAIQESQQPAISMESTTVAPDVNPVDFDGEMEHGRKVQVKRRMLKEDLPGSIPENQSESNSSIENTPSGNAGNFAGSDQAVQPETSTDEISFGRR